MANIEKIIIALFVLVYLLHVDCFRKKEKTDLGMYIMHIFYSY